MISMEEPGSAHGKDDNGSGQQTHLGRRAASDPTNCWSASRKLPSGVAKDMDNALSPLTHARHIGEGPRSEGNVGGGSGVGIQKQLGTSAKRHNELWEWLSECGLQHYMMILCKQGLTVEQLQAMNDLELQDAGIVTPSAIAQIRRAC
jgi:hypothetical protein